MCPTKGTALYPACSAGPWTDLKQGCERPGVGLRNHSLGLFTWCGGRGDQRKAVTEMQAVKEHLFNRDRAPVPLLNMRYPLHVDLMVAREWQWADCREVH